MGANGHPAPTAIEPGVEISSTTNTSGIAAALAAVAQADVTVVVVGIDHNVEHEGVDRENTTLPGLQESFALQVISKAKKTVLILIGDDCNSIDNLVDGSDAIIKAFYPSTQGDFYCWLFHLEVVYTMLVVIGFQLSLHCCMHA